MTRLSLLLLATLLTQGEGVIGRQFKRKNAWSTSAMPTMHELLSKAADMLTLARPAHVYHADMAEDRGCMISALWSDTLLSLGSRFSSANPALTALLEGQREEGQLLDNRFTSRAGGRSRWENALTALFRARSQKIIPLETAALSIVWLYYRVPGVVWDGIGYFTRAVMSKTWAETLADEAVDCDPGPQYAVVQQITGAVFDNFQMRVGYSSYATANSAGRKIEMTNWATAFLPASAMPAAFDVLGALGAGGIFRTDLSRDAVLDSFSLLAPDIVSNMKSRFISFLNAAASGCDLWLHETYNSPYPPTKFHYHDPIFDRLQSSYEDVNFELDTMRNHQYHKYSHMLMVGGDGLSYMRLIHRLSQNPRRFLESTPVIVPRLGENPHGLFHLMHGDWRMWAPLLLRLAAVVGNKSVREDPSVQDFNTHQHFYRVVVMALSEYVAEISRSGTDFRFTSHFLADAERNLSFGYIVFFLYFAGFKFVQYKKACHTNDSATLDQIWRENLTTTRTAKANKTNYRQMSVILIYWGIALIEPLNAFYHNTRTLRWIHSHVGWDMPIEKLNYWISESVTCNITEWQIVQFIRRLNFMQHVVRCMKLLIRFNRKPDTATLKDIRTDVDMIKDFVRSSIGSTYSQATTPSDDNLLGVDMKDWGGLRRARASAPWTKLRLAARSNRAYVRRQLAKLCPWHQWQQ